MSDLVAEDIGGLVNRLTQELAQVRRELATGARKLGTATRSLDARTQELAEARAALALLLATLDCTSDGLVAMGYFGRAMHFNQRFIEMWRIPQDKASSLSEDSVLAMQLSQVKDPQGFLEQAQLARGQREDTHTSVIETTDGRTIECRVMPQRANGRRVGVVTSYRVLERP